MAGGGHAARSGDGSSGGSDKQRVAEAAATSLETARSELNDARTAAAKDASAVSNATSAWRDAEGEMAAAQRALDSEEEKSAQLADKDRKVKELTTERDALVAEVSSADDALRQRSEELRAVQAAAGAADTDAQRRDELRDRIAFYEGVMRQVQAAAKEAGVALDGTPLGQHAGGVSLQASSMASLGGGGGQGEKQAANGQQATYEHDGAPGYLTTVMGISVRCMTLIATEPMSRAVRLVRPWLPMTIWLQPSSLA